MNLLQRPVTTKPPKPKKDRAHLAKVGAMPCCICDEYGFPQLTPTQVHHVIHGRYGFRKSPDSMTIPLCRAHHLTGEDGYIAVHQSLDDWKERYGEDHRWISWVEKRLGKDEA